jgi:hypothetical protein
LPSSRCVSTWVAIAGSSGRHLVSLRVKQGPRQRRTWHRLGSARCLHISAADSQNHEEQTMKSFPDRSSRLGLNTDFRKGVAFALASLAVFAGLIIVQRPHWAHPWLIASFFTFLVWRLGRREPRS